VVFVIRHSSFPPHVIRLREPWTIRCDATEAQGGAEGRRLTLRRSFNRPTGLHPDDHIWLTVEGLARISQVRFNDRPVDLAPGGSGVLRCDIHAWLAPRNEVVIDVASECDESGDAAAARIRRDVLSAGLVRLEIVDQSAQGL
jgi:hypothetical protein